MSFDLKVYKLERARLLVNTQVAPLTSFMALVPYLYYTNSWFFFRFYGALIELI